MTPAAPASGILWAMHPGALQTLLHQAAFEALMPDTLQLALTAFTGQGGAASRLSPVRDGAVMVVPIDGMLAPRGMIQGAMAYEDVADRVREGAADRRVSAIVLDVRSPGGTVGGCSEAGDAIYEARSIKPVIAVASPFCFSAAHWLATQAGSYFATPSGDVGSVGVRTGHTDHSGFERKIGIVTTLVASSPDKVAGHPHAPLAEADRATMQAGVDEADLTFRRAIARGRRMRLDDVRRVHGAGRTFSAHLAARLGSIDGVTTLREVVLDAKAPGSRLKLMRRLAALRDLEVGI